RIDSSDFYTVTIERKHGLERLDRLPLIAALEEAATGDGSRLDTVPDARFEQALPREVFAGINLAYGGDIAVCKHPLGRDIPPSAAISTQFDDRRDLRFRKIRQSAGVAGIDDLDADGGGIGVRLALPEALAGMPGAVGLAHELLDATVLMDQV